MKKENELTSGRLQDLEKTLEIICSSGRTMRFIYKIGLVPYLTFAQGITDKEWISILKFNIKQEKELLKFEDELKRKHEKGKK